MTRSYFFASVASASFAPGTRRSCKHTQERERERWERGKRERAKGCNNDQNRHIRMRAHAYRPKNAKRAKHNL